MAIRRGVDQVAQATLSDNSVLKSMVELAADLRVLSRRFGIPFSIPGLVPDFYRSERASLIRRGRAFGWGQLIGGVAAQFAYFQLVNPTTSKVNLLVLAAGASPSASGEVVCGRFVGVAQFAGTVVAAPTFANLRTPGTPELEPGFLNPSPQALLLMGNRSAGVGVFPGAAEFTYWDTQTTAQTPVVFPGDVLCEIAPGNSFVICDNTAGQGCFFSVQWGEIDPTQYQ